MTKPFNLSIVRVMILEINNSFCQFKGDLPKKTEDFITKALTYEKDIASEINSLWYQHKNAKWKGNTKQCKFILNKIHKLESEKFVCLFKKGQFATGLLNIVREILTRHKIDVKIKDLREEPEYKGLLKWNNVPHTPRPYQKEMIDKGLEAGRGVFVAAVGSGKTMVAAYIIKKQAVSTLFIVPSTALLQQVTNEFKIWFGGNNVEMLNTKKVRSAKSFKLVKVINIQALAALNKSGDIDKLLKGVESIHIDEAHHIGARSFTDLLPHMDHIYYRYGYSGSFLRTGSDSLSMWSVLSNVLYSYPAHRGIEEGYLTPLEVKVHTLGGEYSRSYPKEYEKNYCGSKELLDKITEIIRKVPEDKQILILVKQKAKGGALIHKHLKLCGIKSVFISGDNTKEEITEGIVKFNEKEIKILIGSSVLGEGVDISATDHLIMAQGGKSEITMTQAMGRAIRLCKGKTLAVVHDFDFKDTKYMKKHTQERLDGYERNFEPNKISYE